MKLKLSFINSLPALPFGAFKIGGELTIDTELELDKSELLQMAKRHGLEDKLHSGPDDQLDVYVVERCMREFLKRNHELMWKSVNGLPVEMFDIDQLKEERANRR